MTFVEASFNMTIPKGTPATQASRAMVNSNFGSSL